MNNGLNSVHVLTLRNLVFYLCGEVVYLRNMYGKVINLKFSVYKCVFDILFSLFIP